MIKSKIQAKLRYPVGIIIKNIDWLSLNCKIPEYLYLQKKNFKDTDYFSRFSSYYKLRFFKKNNISQKKYFELLIDMESTGDTNFSKAYQILSKIAEVSQLSYTSKLIATIDPAWSVVDAHVLYNLSIYRPYIKNKTARNEKDLEIYSEANTFIAQLCKHKDGKVLLKAFDSKTKAIRGAKGINKVKKIDFMLWKFSKKNLKSNSI